MNLEVQTALGNWRIIIMRGPSSRARRIITRSGTPVAVLLAGLLVWQGSNAAFSSSTHNDGNNWATGSVSLSNDANAAMFSVKGLVPMQTGSKCIVVTANSSVPGLVHLYAGQLAANGLEPYVKLTIQQGTGGTFNDCYGFNSVLQENSQTLATLAADHTSYSTGLVPWITAGVTSGESRTYKFDWVFDTTGLSQVQINDLQGRSASINIHWELQNT
jgi:hypothetical protein